MTEVNWEKEYIELAEKYEELLEGLPQYNFSKAGTPPEWVIKEVERNILHKLDVQDDIRDILMSSDEHGYSWADLANEIMDYLEIKKDREVVSFDVELPEYDQDEAIEYIQKSLKGMNKQYINRGFLVAVLDAEENYMRSKGIIEE